MVFKLTNLKTVIGGAGGVLTKKATHCFKLTLKPNVNLNGTNHGTKIKCYHY